MEEKSQIQGHLLLAQARPIWPRRAQYGRTERPRRSSRGRGGSPAPASRQIGLGRVRTKRFRVEGFDEDSLLFGRARHEAALVLVPAAGIGVLEAREEAVPIFGRIASGEHGVDEAVHVVALAPGVSMVGMMISAMVSTLSSAFPASILNMYRRGHSALSKRPIQISKVVPPISTSEGFVQDNRVLATAACSHRSTGAEIRYTHAPILPFAPRISGICPTIRGSGAPFARRSSQHAIALGFRPAGARRHVADDAFRASPGRLCRTVGDPPVCLSGPLWPDHRQHPYLTIFLRPST